MIKSVDTTILSRKVLVDWKMNNLIKLNEKEYIKLDRDKSTFKSHRDFNSEIEMTFKHF